MSTGELELSEEEDPRVGRLAGEGASGWRLMSLGGEERVAHLDLLPALRLVPAGH